ncbi:uncharacterized protein LOC103700950 [Phoenix dactylifera]|uniref:Uncharacterized protein LOC103700950 n=1 Tax=Phoenix dactylifera TaxID=42345 RepID=A0A8B7BLL0_PHODC|nr:uncharacterized protein LOC103700950 [Phoenix dactylifera]
MLKDPSPMASPPTLGCWFFRLALLCLFITCCESDQDPVDVAAKALTCFNDHYIYSSCEESCRLSAAGTIDVPLEATDQYCEGPCLVETKLVLQCVDSILYNFQFYNGATVQDVKYALNTGCGHTSKRGDFNVLERLEGGNGEYGYYGHGNKLGIPMHLMVLLSCVLLLSGF